MKLVIPCIATRQHGWAVWHFSVGCSLGVFTLYISTPLDQLKILMKDQQIILRIHCFLLSTSSSWWFIVFKWEKARSMNASILTTLSWSTAPCLYCVYLALLWKSITCSQNSRKLSRLTHWAQAKICPWNPSDQFSSAPKWWLRLYSWITESATGINKWMWIKHTMLCSVPLKSPVDMSDMTFIRNFCRCSVVLLIRILWLCLCCYGESVPEGAWVVVVLSEGEMCRNRWEAHIEFKCQTGARCMSHKDVYALLHGGNENAVSSTLLMSQQDRSQVQELLIFPPNVSYSGGSMDVSFQEVFYTLRCDITMSSHTLI